MRSGLPVAWSPCEISISVALLISTNSLNSLAPRPGAIRCIIAIMAVGSSGHRIVMVLWKT